MNNGVEDACFVHKLVLSVVDVRVVSAQLLILQSLSAGSLTIIWWSLLCSFRGNNVGDVLDTSRCCDLKMKKA